MAVKVREHDGPLEPITWPTGEDVAVKRPNIYASKFWTKGDSEAALDGMVQFVSMICPGKSVDQIMEECDENFLILVCGYARENLEAAMEALGVMLGKSVAGTAVPASAPPTTSGTSPVVSPAPTGVPCGT
jgi:hypothetical protein